MRTLKTLAPLELNVKSAVQHFIYQIRAFVPLFWTGLFLVLELWTQFEFTLFCLCITPVITVSTSFVGFSIDLLCELIDWSLNDLDALIEVYSSYLIYVLFIDIINFIFPLLLMLLLFICFLIHSILVVLVFLCILLFCWLSVLCCLCCHCVLEPYNPFAIITLYLFLLLFNC